MHLSVQRVARKGSPNGGAAEQSMIEWVWVQLGSATTFFLLPRLFQGRTLPIPSLLTSYPAAQEEGKKQT